MEQQARCHIVTLGVKQQQSEQKEKWNPDFLSLPRFFCLVEYLQDIILSEQFQLDLDWAVSKQNYLSLFLNSLVDPNLLHWAAALPWEWKQGMKDSHGQASCLGMLWCCWKTWLTAGDWKHDKALECLGSYFIISLCRSRLPPAGQGAPAGCCVGTCSLFRVQRAAEVGQGAEPRVSVLFPCVYIFLFLLIFKGA